MLGTVATSPEQPASQLTQRGRSTSMASGSRRFSCQSKYQFSCYPYMQSFVILKTCNVTEETKIRSCDGTGQTLAKVERRNKPRPCSKRLRHCGSNKQKKSHLRRSFPSSSPLPSGISGVSASDTPVLVSISAIRIERQNIPPDSRPHVATARGEQIACRAGSNRDDCKTQLDTGKLTRSATENGKTSKGRSADRNSCVLGASSVHFQ